MISKYHIQRRQFYSYEQNQECFVWLHQIVNEMGFVNSLVPIERHFTDILL
jgi:hypothetical protein